MRPASPGRGVILVVLVAALGAQGAGSKPLREAIFAYERGQPSVAEGALRGLADERSLSPEDHGIALEYLAAVLFDLGRAEECRATLERLYLEQPGAEFSSAIFLPELIALAQKTRQELASQQAKAPEPRFDASRGPAVVEAPPVEPPALDGGLRGKAWIAAVAGVALGGAGGALLAISQNTAAEILRQDSKLATVEDLDGALNRGRAQQTAGTVLLIAGGAALLAAGGLVAFGGPAQAVSVTAVVGPGSAGVSVTGSLP